MRKGRLYMYIIDSEEFNTNYPLCQKCGGECCKRNACDCSPEDFEKDIAKMREALESGKYCIDFSREDASSFFIGANRTILVTERIKKSHRDFLYIRPKNVGRPVVDIIHTEEVEGPCIFWDEKKGCPLDYKNRPKGGRTLIPQASRICIPPYDKLVMLMDWKPFTSELIKLAKEFFDPTWELYKLFNFTIE